MLAIKAAVLFLKDFIGGCTLLASQTLNLPGPPLLPVVSTLLQMHLLNHVFLDKVFQALDALHKLLIVHKLVENVHRVSHSLVCR